MSTTLDEESPAAVRRRAVRALLAWGAATVALLTVVYVWVGREGSITLPLFGVGIPGAMALVSLLELATGVPLAAWERRWAALSAGRKLLISVAVVLVAFLTFAAVIMPLVVTGVL